jgi:hypothetical protein
MLSSLPGKRRLRREAYLTVQTIFILLLLGAGGPEFESRRSDQNISRVLFDLLKACFTQNPSVEFWQTGGLNSQAI